MKKVFLFLGLMLCVTMMQAKQIYLNANIWDVDSPAFYAHAWGGGDADVKLKKVSGTVYSGEVPDGTTYVIFLRMNPEGGFDWSKEWNRTGDLLIPAGKDLFKITAWHENNDDSKPSVGDWSVYDSTTPGGGETPGGDTPGGGGGCEESYGLLIDGEYHAGTKNPSPLDDSFIEYYLTGVQLTAGQHVQVHSKCADASWVITKYANTSYEFAVENDAYKVSESSTYDFYLKFKMGADEIYVSCASCKEEPVTSGSVPRQCEDVMIQAFYNESYWPDSAELGTDLYGDTKWATLLPQAEEMAHSFDLIWLPPSAYGDGMGYHPKQYSNQNSNWGTREELEALIAAFHNAGSKVVADIVINHCASWSTWCDFPEMDFGEFGKFQPDASYICSNDEVNWEENKPTEEKEGSGECWGTATGSPDDGDNWSGARDWSHDKVYVQEMFIAYLKWMREVMKYDGFRYDKGDGFNNWHHWNYNQHAKPYIAFMESYNGTDEIQREINEAKGDLMGLDFDLKWHVFNSIAGWDYSRGRGDCIMSRGDGKHSVTFMESHDWFLRPDNENEFCGRGNSMKPEVKARLMQCNAMLLSLPGVPCVFYPHWAKYKEDLKPMIAARKAAGVHSESSTNDEEASATGYKITVVGKRGNLILMLGDKVQGDTPASWLPDNNYYKMASNYSTMEGHNESFEIWVSMFDGSDPREYDPSKPVDPDPEPEVPENLKPDPSYSNSAPEKCTDVMIQGFYWDSNELETMPGSTTSVYGSTAWARLMKNKSKETNEYIADEMGKWFDLIWLPPFSRSTGGTGYLPIQYSDLNSDWGTKANLNKLIKKFHGLGARVIEDIVINHCSGEPSWCTFAKQDFGEYGVYQPTAAWICKTDDMNWSEEAQDPEEGAGSCFGTASGNNDEGYDGLDDFKGGRDLDHKNVNVQLMCKAYLKWLVNNVYVDGFRYDYCKGFKNGYIADYNSVASPYFTVMEMWDNRVGDLQYHLNEARRTSMTFDFATKFSAFNDGIANGNYGALRGSGLLGAGESRYAVTFIDNHDTFLRDEKEFLGYGNSLANDENKAKVLQCNAFILSMPGVPCVFFPHWITFKNEIKAMINARYKTGVHSQSSVEDEASHDYYKATIHGTNGDIRLLIGPASGYNSTPAGYTLAVKGTNFGVYYKLNSPRGDKDTERTPIPQGIEEVEEGQNAVMTEKFIHNGLLYIRIGDKVYDVMGRNVQ